MGQRLNIEIIKNSGEVIANCYYHWGGYTMSALEPTLQVVNAFNKIKDENLPDEVLAVKLLESTCSLSFTDMKIHYAGSDKKSLEYLKEKYPDYEFNSMYDRNVGIIGVVEEDISSTRQWCEGVVYINIESQIIDASDIVYGIDIEEYNKEYIYEEDEPVDLDNLKEIPDFSNISFNKIEELTKSLNNDSCHMYKRSNENLVYTFVE